MVTCPVAVPTAMLSESRNAKAVIEGSSSILCSHNRQGNLNTRIYT